MGEAELRTAGLPTYLAVAPTVGEMTSAALRFLAPGPFLLVVEEEGSDNFANCNNGQGTLDALKRADEALGVAMGFVEKHPDTLLVTTADSSAGAMDVLGFVPKPERMVLAVAGRDANGAPYSLDPEGKPFLSQPDKAGKRHPFVLVWGTRHDTSGGILVRAMGKNAPEVSGSFDNTRIYSLMRDTLFDD
jgi:alkaline phosphatase